MKLFSTLSAGLLALVMETPSARPATPAPAVASTLAVTGLLCYDTGGGGFYYNTTFCTASVSGGTGVYTFDWDVIVTSRSDGPSSSQITGVCTDSYPVTFTVTDSNNATASAYETFVCYAKSTGGGIEP